MKYLLSIIIAVLMFSGCSQPEVTGELVSHQEVREGLRKVLPAHANVPLLDNTYMVPNHDELLSVLSKIAHDEQYAFHYRSESFDCDKIAAHARVEVQRYVKQPAAILMAPVTVQRGTHQVIAVYTSRGLYKWDPQYSPISFTAMRPNEIERAYSL